MSLKIESKSRRAYSQQHNWLGPTWCYHIFFNPRNIHFILYYSRLELQFPQRQTSRRLNVGEILLFDHLFHSSTTQCYFSDLVQLIGDRRFGFPNDTALLYVASCSTSLALMRSVLVFLSVEFCLFLSACRLLYNSIQRLIGKVVPPVAQVYIYLVAVHSFSSEYFWYLR